MNKSVYYLLTFRNIISILLSVYIIHEAWKAAKARISIMWRTAANKYVVQKIINILIFRIYFIIIMTK